MRALELVDFNKMDIVELPSPLAGHGEVIVDTVATGICGSDIHGFTGHNGRRVPGQVMGHETVGRVSALGPGTESSGLQVGQPVTFNPLLACGTCASCTVEHPQHCAQRRIIGVTPDITAAFAEKTAVPAENIVPLSEEIPIAYGALIEPLAVAFHAVRRAGLRPGQKVLVIGGGPIGQSVVLAALQEGAAEVLVSEVDPHRRALCNRIGARALNPATSPVASQVQEQFGSLADVTVDAVGITATMGDALNATRIGGTVALVGMGDPELRLDAYRVSTEERQVVGSFCYNNRDFVDAAAWVNLQPKALAELISREVGLTDAAGAFAALAAGDGTPGKILVRFGSDVR
jgi:threonine dehydrogenase-like Zn-dependent dehydrogenase